VGNIQPNISFENVPEDWTCPVRGTGKDQFVALS
jgi:rubredoxin